MIDLFVVWLIVIELIDWLIRPIVHLSIHLLNHYSLIDLVNFLNNNFKEAKNAEKN